MKTCCRKSAPRRRTHGFTLIELILVLALLVVITSITTPAMARFIRGRALDTEARRMIALMHLAQSRAVSEAQPMVFWVNEKTGEYGVIAESAGTSNVGGEVTQAVSSGDAKAEDMTLDSTLAVTVQAAGVGGSTTFNNLPAIRFLVDGTVDEDSPKTLKLMDSDGFARWLTETPLRTGYEIQTTGQ